MRGPKVARICDGCRQPKKARWRTLVDRYLCPECYRTPSGVPASPLAVGAQQNGKSITVTGLSVPTGDDVEFDLSHLTGGRE